MRLGTGRAEETGISLCDAVGANEEPVWGPKELGNGFPSSAGAGEWQELIWAAL